MGLYVRTILCFFVLVAYMNVAFAAPAITPNKAGRIMALKHFTVGMAVYCSHDMVQKRSANNVAGLYNSFLQTNAPLIRKAQAVLDKVAGPRVADTIATKLLNKTQNLIHSGAYDCQKAEALLSEMNQYDYNNNPVELAEMFDRTGLDYNTTMTQN